MTRPAERLNGKVETGAMVTVLGIAAAGWGLIMAVAPVLQIRRMIALRSSQDVSLGYYGILLPGFALWAWYGTARAEWALVVPNTVAFATGILTIGVARLLRRAAGQRSRHAAHDAS